MAFSERFLVFIIWKRKERFEIHRDKGLRFLRQIYSPFDVSRGKKKRINNPFLARETIENGWKNALSFSSKRPIILTTNFYDRRRIYSGRKLRVEGKFYELDANLKKPRKGRRGSISVKFLLRSMKTRLSTFFQTSSKKNGK